MLGKMKNQEVAFYDKSKRVTLSDQLGKHKIYILPYGSIYMGNMLITVKQNI